MFVRLIRELTTVFLRLRSNRFGLAAVEIDQRALQVARLWRQQEGGKVRNIFRLAQPDDVRRADDFCRGGLQIAAMLFGLAMLTSREAGRCGYSRD